VPSLGLEAALEALEAAKEAKRENAVRQMRLDAGAASLDTSTSWVSPLVAQTERIQSEVNEFDARAQSESERSNPFMEQIRRLKKEFEEADIDAGVISWNAEKAKLKALSYGQIQDLSLSLRGALLQKAVKDIETATNLCMETYFDAELRVTFELEGSDSLKVGIFKSGYEASYKQLSKGQRQLLKLSYSVAVMKASSNIAGTHFSTLFFDEALDGLDAELKVKAFTLFESMSQDHETVMLIDHSPDFHQLFTTKFHVTLDGDESSIEEEHE
jgi:DNA repair exonuclease SbcCD ATPase subunit